MIKFDSSNVESVKNDMLIQINNILGTLDRLIKKINDSNEIFDTPASKYFQERAINLINLQKNEINSDLIPFVNKLNFAISSYDDCLDEIRKMIG